MYAPLVRYNPPPNWPAPPEHWEPPPGWRPDPRWGPPPPGWVLWVDDSSAAAAHISSDNPRSKFVGAIKHPVWIGIGTVVTALTLVVAGVSYLQGQGGSGKLEIAAVTIESPKPIAASNITIGTLEETPRSGYAATPIDITVKNDGGVPVHITRVTAEPLYSSKFTCDLRGGGLSVTAEYSLTMPTKFANGVAVSSEEVSATVDYLVKPRSLDRMTVTVGPDDKIGSWLPFVFVSTLQFETDDGRILRTRPLALVTPTGIDEELERFRDPDIRSMTTGFDDCLAGYLDAFKAATPADALRSPELDRWLSGLEQISQS